MSTDAVQGRAPAGMPGEMLAGEPTPTGRSAAARDLLRFMRANPGFACGVGIVLVATILMAVGPVIGPYDPNDQDANAILVAPGGSHLLGTDPNGRDILSRVLAAPRVDLYIAVVSTLVAALIGVPLGVLASGIGRRAALFGEIVMRIMDVLQAFPIFVLALALVAAAGPSAQNIIIALVILQFPVFVRLARSAALGLRRRAFVEAAQVAGASSLTVTFRHVLPNAMAPPLIGISVAVAQAILLTAGLSFVGAGIRPPTAEWGAMISDGAQTLITGQWWPSVFPGIALGVTVLGFALVGDGLRRFIDPSRR